MTLPTHIHSVAQVRAMDRHAIEVLGIPGYTLMTRAAAAALATVQAEWPEVSRLVVVCGVGNNAGDGYVLARLASQAGYQVTLLSVMEGQVLTGDAARARQDFIAAGGIVQAWNPSLLREAELLIDAMFGTGLSRDLDARLCDCVQAINRSDRPVLALDVPSGLDADTGLVRGAAIHAQATITFVGLKQGFYLGAGPDHVGRIHCSTLDIPAAVANEVGDVATRITEQLLQDTLPPRPRTAHKGLSGHVLIVGGGPGMAGAVRLSGEACLRVGAGLVTVATHPDHAHIVTAGRPELMCRGVMQASELAPLIERADVIAIGPGLGRDAWARQLLEAVLGAEQPLVLDADALNLLAETPQHSERWILTPHPGEAARLLHTGTAAIQADRLGAVRQLQQRYGGTVVLKGAGTLVCSGDEVPALCDRGNPGMAVPGMGDVLTGVIAGVLAQLRNTPAALSRAAQAGVYLHARAGDLAAMPGERGVLASDLFAHLREGANP